MAVAFTKTGPGQNHTGVAHASGGRPAVFLHLAWHHQLIQEDAPGFCTYTMAPVHPLRIPAMTGMFRLIARENERGRIPYGLRPHDGCFDERTGRWLLGPVGPGLTCATFVIAVMHRVGMALVRPAHWPVRPDDIEWQESIVETLRLRSPAQAEYVRDEVGCARFRPEEVAGAALAEAEELPVSFERAIELGSRVVAFHLDHAEEDGRT